MRDKKGRFTEDSKPRLTHGMTYTNFYTRYSAMKARCENPKIKGYPRYGGRGIKCLWKSFEEFKKDMYQSFCGHVEQYGVRETSLDRINYNGNYYLKNCRWVTPREQARNSSWNKRITYKRENHCISEWAEILGCNIGALYGRVERGWSIDRIFNQPFRKSR